MKTHTVFRAEKAAENLLFIGFIGLAIYIKIQIIIFIIDCFHDTEVQTAIATLI
ncbi:hypothetical protein [Formosa maritima]|uniref:hypothetical protein n=1 Tax=Formosa maritima TaxID=2592046 RepID=UPI0013159C1A|nr:hypothetical protein [Formosa maritima]